VLGGGARRGGGMLALGGEGRAGTQRRGGVPTLSGGARQGGGGPELSGEGGVPELDSTALFLSSLLEFSSFGCFISVRDSNSEIDPMFRSSRVRYPLQIRA